MVHPRAVLQNLEFFRAGNTFLQVLNDHKQLRIRDLGGKQELCQFGCKPGAIVTARFELARLCHFDKQRFNFDAGYTHKDYLCLGVANILNLTPHRRDVW
jgi:hypothetical protein